LPVDDRFRQARRARAVEHPERMVEGKLCELELSRRELPIPSGERGDPEGPLNGRQLPLQLREGFAPVEVPSAVAVAVPGEQHLRLDLGETVDDAANAELGRTARPGCTDARAAEKGRDRLRDVREIAGDAVSGPHPRLPQRFPDRARARPQLAPGPFAERTQLRRMPDRD